MITCGPTVVYGWEGGGFTTCESEAGRPTRASDPWGTATDSDPIVELDIPMRHLVVRDDNPASTWSVTITWSDPPAAPPPAPQAP